MNWPFENDTGSIIRRLAKRSLQSEKRRNIMVIISVALSAFLISFGGGLMVSLSQQQNKEVEDTYEAVFSNITKQEISMLREEPGISRAGEYYLTGEELSDQGFKGTFIYTDEAMLYIGRQQLNLIDGKLPQRSNEIVVSVSWLEKYARETQTGDMVTLGTDSFPGEYVISGVMDTFTVEGSDSYSFLISEEQLLQYPGYDAAGYRSYIHLQNDMEMSGEEIKTYCEAIAEKYGLAAPAYNSRYLAWASRGKSLEMLGVTGLLAAFVLTGGCIVIQSIFRISIIDKIQSFGQLRTIGATKKQIMKIVSQQGRRLVWIGIFIGIIPGLALPVFLIPDGWNVQGFAGILLATALICRITTGLSIKKPVKIAAGVSPVEAVRFVPEQNMRSKGRKLHKKITPLSLARLNLCRDKKKTLSILVSLSIGGILLLCASTLLFTYSPDAIARKYYPNGNYKIYISSEKELSEVFRSGNPLTEELRREILAIDGVEGVITTRQSIGTDFRTEFLNGGGMGDMITPDNYSVAEAALTEGSMPHDAHSILVAQDYEGIKAGTVIQLSLGGNITDVTVSGLISLNKLKAGYGHGNLGLDGAMLYLPEGLFEEQFPGMDNFDYSWDIVSDPAKDITVRVGLEELVKRHTGLGIDRYTDKLAYSQSTYSDTFHILQGIALFISVFGVINLINTTLSNQLARRQEVSILRSAGMTRKQLCRMITLEGTGYVISSVLLTILAGLPIAYLMHRQFSMVAYGSPTDFHFPFLYIMLYFILLVVIEYILSAWTIRRQQKQTLIEQLRALE